ncbi:MAG: DegT/DnrJ/EryC1/StrS family aminotransferase [Actinomycetes bacterium]
MTAIVGTDTLPAVLGGRRAFDFPLPPARPAPDDLPTLTEAIGRVVEPGTVNNRSTVDLLEEAVAERLGVNHVVGVSSWKTGMALTLRQLGVAGPVVMPSLGGSGSADALRWSGGSPAFTDVLPHSLTLDPVLAARLTPGAVAMTGTHIYGAPCRVDALQQVADRAAIPVVYDAADALGSTYRGVPIGRFGTAEVFSLGLDGLTAEGDGGLVATSDAELARNLRIARDSGSPGIPESTRLSGTSAAVALHELETLDERIALRTRLARRFQTRLAGMSGLTWPTLCDGDTTTYKRLTLVIDARRFGLTAVELARALQAEGIAARRSDEPPLHRRRDYASLPAVDLSVTDRVAAQVLDIPLWSRLTDLQIDAVANAVERIHRSAPNIATAMRPGRHVG